MRFHPKPSHLLPLLPPPSSHRTKASHVDSSLGKGSPTSATAARAILEARGPSEATAASVQVRPNCPYVVGLLWTNCITEGVQNGLP
jgi:hypothetical protein